MRVVITLAASVLMVGIATASAEPQLPPEVTPALRAACEADVRRLCITDGSTVQTVRQCVMAKFFELGPRCRKQIALAGLSP